MLSSINPLGERARGQSFPVTVSFYVLGSVIGGAAIGTAGGVVGTYLPNGSWRLLVVASVASVGAWLDFVGKRPLSIHRQVDENWLTRYRGWVYGLGFGVQLGLGVVTIVTTAAVYTMIAMAVLLGSPLWGAALGLAFGASRGAAILRVANVGAPDQLRRVMHSLQGGVEPATRLVVGAQVVAAAVVMVVLV